MDLELCNITITYSNGAEETISVTDIVSPLPGCHSQREYTKRLVQFGLMVESIDGNGDVTTRHISPHCLCEVSIFCPQP